jgi:NAD(P)H-hydrate epimerase
VDAIFGFSFKPPIRTPYDLVIEALKAIKTPIISVDNPSG